MGLRTAILAVVLCLAGLTGAPLRASAKPASAADLASALKVDAGELLMFAPIRFASANGGRTSVNFVPGVFVETAGRVHILRYDPISKTFQRAMSFEIREIPAVGLVSSPLGLKQLQIKTETGVVACDFGGVFENARITSQVYERLTAAGIRTFEPADWIDTLVTTGPAPIIIYLPAHR